MTTPYRDEMDALRERKESLEREISRISQQTNELDALRSKQEELTRELRSVEQRLGAGAAKRALPLLDQVRVASPCNASWDEMLGDDRVRFCVGCEKNVYNLSSMGREEAEALLESRLGGKLCVRFFQRADGTILTEDCPVGVRKKRRKKLALAIAAVGATALATTQLLGQKTCHTQGEVSFTQQVTTSGTTATPDEPPPRPVMGDVAYDPEPAPAPKPMTR